MKKCYFDTSFFYYYNEANVLIKKKGRVVEKMASKYMKKLVAILFVVFLVANLFPSIAKADGDNNVLTPTEYQYLELRAVDVNDVGGGKQVIMELWAHNLDFKGFQVRFSYDYEKLQPSNMNTNAVTLDSDQYFKFESEFDGKLDFFTTNYTGEGSGIEAIVSLDPPVETSAHIKSRGGNDYYIQSGEDLLLGKMSFNMTAEGYEDGWFSLVTNNNLSPSTGIKISVTIPTYYEAQLTFRFTDETASRDANLSNIIVSHGIKDDDPEVSTYKEYTLVPIFHQDTLNYEIELLEYIDDVDVTPTLSDDTATMTIQVPKRDGNNELVYDGDEIEYEEKTLTNNTPLNVVINKLGEPNTRLKVKVTAEDGVTEKEYTVTIKRPHATIRGSIQLGDGLRELMDDSYGVYLKYIADIKIYNAGDFNWDGVITFESSLEDLDAMEYYTKTESDKDDGHFVLYVIPGTYDLMMDKLGYLPDVTTGISVIDGDEIDLGQKILIEGDVDRTGIIDLDDIVSLVEVMDSMKDDGVYEERFDFGGKDFVSLDDLVSAVANCDSLITINAY